MKLSGQYDVTIYGGDGEIRNSFSLPNVVTTAGKEYLASFLKSAAAGALTFTGKYMAVGTALTAESVGDTALGTELARTTGTASYTSGAIYNITATFATGATVGSISEFGLLTSSANGTLISRTVKSASAVYAVGAADYLVVNYTLTLS